jgi:hypothetical protein
MKRKIRHDAINNQEDEDSSAYPIYFPGDKISNKRKREYIKGKTFYFFNKDSKTIDKSARK